MTSIIEDFSKEENVSPSLLKQKKGNTQPDLLRSCGSPVLEYIMVPGNASCTSGFQRLKCGF